MFCCCCCFVSCDLFSASSLSGHLIIRSDSTDKRIDVRMRNSVEFLLRFNIFFQAFSVFVC